MFSVHGVTGQTFRGTLEEFLAIPGLQRARHSRGVGREGEELGPELRLRRRQEQGRGDAGVAAGGRHGSAAYGQAAQAYRQMLALGPERGPVLHVFQLMSREVFTLHPDEGVERAWQALVGRGYGQAPVLDGVSRLVGQVSVEDLLTVINVDQGQVRDVMPQTVADLMVSPVVSADPVADIRRVARVLLEQHLGGMPVVSDRGELVGIITRSDILRALVNDPPLSLWA
ncbi:MAG: CBS domain-containing protein [Pseudomonadota bacterium]